MKKVAKTVKAHIENIVTYARHRITNALGNPDDGIGHVAYLRGAFYG